MDPRLQDIEEQTRLLKDTMDTFHDIVLDQSLDSIEDIIAASKKEVVQAAPMIKEGRTYSSYMYYAVGVMASIGTTVALLLLL
uniref:Uncharacterized protein n=1 Tax=viral metagenome TaxID=1070528 RepID=A0A6C0KTJ8_9ZZZZ